MKLEGRTLERERLQGQTPGFHQHFRYKYRSVFHAGAVWIDVYHLLDTVASLRGSGSSACGGSIAMYS